MTINLSGPNGNVFFILGMYRRLLKEIGGGTDQQKALLTDYPNMKYEQILEKVTELSNGSITFVRDEEEEEE